MAAPKGNDFWKRRSKHGRDKIFSTPELLWEVALDYFQDCIDNPIEAEDNKGTKNVNVVKFNRPFTRKGFCLFCHVSEWWWNGFKKGELSDDFLQVIRKIEDSIDNQQVEGAIVGLYNSNLVARMQGIKEHTDFTTDNEPINVIFKQK